MTNIFDSLTSKRVLEVFVPDVTREELRKDAAPLLRIDLPEGYNFLGVFNIESPLAALGKTMGGPCATGYGFLCKPSTSRKERFYVASAPADFPVPWPGDNPDRWVPAPVEIQTLGVTTQLGVVLLYLRFVPAQYKWSEFEEAAVGAGYYIVKTKKYAGSQALVQQMLQSMNK